MNKGMQKLGAWSGFIAMNVFFLGLVLTGFFPPPSPSTPTDQLVAAYQSNQFGILMGGLLMIVSAFFCGPFDAVLFLQLRRVEGRARPIGAYAQFAGGIANIAFFILPGLLFVLAAFRPDRPPEVLSALNDLAWIIALLPWTVGASQCFFIGLAILTNEPSKAYPRWVGFFNIWITIGMITSSVIPFFKSGVFAWNGIVGFWIPATVFGLWMGVMWWMTLKAVANDDGQ